jgi:16S rRNA (guanine527-N7)-methyltransferase
MQGTISHILQDPRLGLDAQSTPDVSRIEQYLQLLIKWNRKINLTAEKSPEDILNRHVFDSLQYSRVIDPGCRVMDIGSGAGFPGIPLKILFSQLHLVMVESQRKRCSFLETVVRELQLENVEVINSRAEDVPDDKASQFDAVVFRAVSDSEACLLLGERFLAPGGTIILKKGPDENLSQLGSNSMFSLPKEVVITSYHGVVSSLLVFGKCFT